MDSKICKICGVDKLLSLYRKEPKCTGGYRPRCKECETKTWRFNENTYRNAHLKRTYGITYADEQKMLEIQGFKCAACFRHQSDIKAKFHIDHDHVTGKVRGVLCGTCNQALGNVSDSIPRLRGLIAYLENPGTNRG